MEIFLCAASWHGLAEFAVGGGFGEVQVGDEKSFCFGSEDGVFGQEMQGFVGPLHGGVGLGCLFHWRGA